MGHNRVTVACVLRSGGVYDDDWVRRLKRGVERHTTVDHRFVCLTEAPIAGVSHLYLKHEWPGWWSKIELWRPSLFEGRVVYFDLDTLIVGNIDPLLEYDGPMATLRDFHRSRIGASGVMAWDAGDAPDLYTYYLRDGCPTESRSDFWWNQYANPRYLQDIFPGMIGSYKVHQLADGPEPYKIVCFHGQPKQTDLTNWVADEWEALAA